MELISYNNNSKKNIICFGRNKLAISSLIEKFDVADKIAYICDNNKKLHGFTTIKEFEYQVVGAEIFENIDVDEYDIVITSSFYSEIYEQLKLLPKINKKDAIYLFIDVAIENEKKYRKKYEESSLENIIVFRSGPMPSQYVKGTDFADNSRALFEYMVDNGYNKKYELIWLVKNPNDYDEIKIDNVKFLSFDWDKSTIPEERDEYYRAICLAKYMFFTDSYGFALNSRSDQVRIQLWHGCGFKTRTNFGRCEHRYDYTTVVSPLYKEIHKEIYGLRDDQVLVTGYAKHDWLYKPYDKNMSEILGIKEAKKYIFWLPTFRIADDKLDNLNQYEINPETGLPIVENESSFLKVNGLLADLDMVMIIKLHPIQKNNLVLDKEYSNIRIMRNQELAEKDLIINRLLASSDALISDYSSVAVDYLNLNRPVAFTLDDVEEYENSRGFVFDNIKEMLPGKEIYSVDDLCDYLKEVAEGIDSEYKKRNDITSKLLKYRDENNCRRICEAFNI